MQCSHTLTSSTRTRSLRRADRLCRSECSQLRLLADVGGCVCVVIFWIWVGSGDTCFYVQCVLAHADVRASVDALDLGPLWCSLHLLENKCVCIHVYIHLTNVCMHVYAHYMYESTDACMPSPFKPKSRMNPVTRRHVCMWARMCVCVFVCLCVCVSRRHALKYDQTLPQIFIHGYVYGAWLVHIVPGNEMCMKEHCRGMIYILLMHTSLWLHARANHATRTHARLQHSIDVNATK